MQELARLGLVRNYTHSPGKFSKTVTAQFIEVLNGSRLYFKNDQELTNSRITCIDIVNNVESALNPQITDPTSGDLRANLTNVQLADLVFVLGQGDEQRAMISAFTMVRNNNSGKHTFFNSTNHIWHDSYVELVNIGNISVDEVITLEVFYDKI